MRKKLFILAIFLLLLCFWYVKAINTDNPNSFGEKQFTIKKGQSLTEISKNLKKQGFLEKTFWFNVYAVISGNKSEFRAGIYELKTDMDIVELVDDIMEQQKVEPAKEVKITLLEGWSVEQMDEYLVSRGLIKEKELIEYSEDYNLKKYTFLADRPRKADLEGYLYPDTYLVFEKSSVGNIADKMLANFNKKLTGEIRARIQAQEKTVFEVLTLASIVEKEMYGYENRRVVADIFLKRLKVGMPLQSDATVNYITEKGNPAPSLKDTQIDDPYNTYKYRGLPPGPICNPSIEAIKAVVYPKETNYWYFLNAPSGEIIFSHNHDEHVRNKYKYLK